MEVPRCDLKEILEYNRKAEPGRVHRGMPQRSLRMSDPEDLWDARDVIQRRRSRHCSRLGKSFVIVLENDVLWLPLRARDLPQPDTFCQPHNGTEGDSKLDPLDLSLSEFLSESRDCSRASWSLRWSRCRDRVFAVSWVFGQQKH